MVPMAVNLHLLAGQGFLEGQEVQEVPLGHQGL